MTTGSFLFDATHTSHTGAQTGIQRVCRALFSELTKNFQTTAVCYDPHLTAWRLLRSEELAVLRDRSGGAGQSRGAKWTLPQKISGRARRLLGQHPTMPTAEALICPELFSAKVGTFAPEIFQHVTGPRVAIFYDAIPLKFPELTPSATVARFPGYLQQLLQFDGIAAISEDSAASLRDYWHCLGVINPPEVTAIPLGVDESILLAEAPTEKRLPRVLSVGTIEGRKNHLALLEACDRLWNEGQKFELQVIGLARADTAGAAVTKIAQLQHAGHPLLYQGSANEATLQAAYRQSSFTVYPSLMEGFGLPVLESLQHGRPCICSARGALGESARGGGCVMLDLVDATSLAAAIRNLVQNPVELTALARAARERRLKTWSAYAAEFAAWTQALPRRR